MTERVARTVFTAAADAYERGRPSYPSDVVDLVPRGSVVDVGAGTGKLTAALARRGDRVIAVEPLASMRVRIAGAAVLGGAAESLPLRDGFADAVTAAQAFHWFHPVPAIAEAARVLRPAGTLLLVWNERDDGVPWVRELDELFDWPVQRPYPKGVDWAGIVDAAGSFTPCAHRQLRWSQRLDAETLVARVLSTSYVARWPAAERDALAARVRQHVSDFARTFDLPYVTDVFWCSKRS